SPSSGARTQQQRNSAAPRGGSPSAAPYSNSLPNFKPPCVQGISLSGKHDLLPEFRSKSRSPHGKQRRTLSWIPTRTRPQLQSPKSRSRKSLPPNSSRSTRLLRHSSDSPPIRMYLPQQCVSTSPTTNAASSSMRSSSGRHDSETEPVVDRGRAAVVVL